MMKSRYEILIVAAVLGVAELIWIETHADQATVDEGVGFAKSLQGGVQNLATTTNANTVPAYNGTNLPQVQYFNNQNLNGLQTDATVQLGSGTASEASQYAYDQSLLPRLSFGVNDPILTNSSGVSTNALLNPDVLTVPTGNCAVADVNNPETRLEHCTAWMLPTNHTCNKTMNVDVQWQSQVSCTLGTTFNESSIHTPLYNYIVKARPYCNPGSGDDVFLQAYKDSWFDFMASINQPRVYTGISASRVGNLQDIPVFVSGSCGVNNQCSYDVMFLQLIEFAGPQRVCNGNKWTLSQYGYHGKNFLPYYVDGKHCGYDYHVNLQFEKPTITRTPTVTENWTNGCAALEAQL